MSEFWKRKMRTCFSLFDFDKDGVCSKDDLIEIAIQFAKSAKADDQKTEHLKAIYEEEWKQLMKTAEDPDKKEMTVDEFIDTISKQRYDPELMNVYSNELRANFDLMDLKCAGYIQEDEHERMFAQFGVKDPSFAREAFRAIDVNGDGKVSYDQYVNAFFDFMFSEDEESPTKLLAGPLVD